MSPARANGIQLKRSVRKSEDHDDVRVWVAGALEQEALETN
jgi:hypothetical protein